MNAVATPRKVSATVVARRLAKSVDRLARLNAIVSRAQAEAEMIKASLKSCGFDTINGTHHKAVVVTTDVSRFDTAMAKHMLTAEEVAACTKTAKRVAISLYDL